MSKIIKSFEIINHGWDNSQSFQGCGTAFTTFEDVATGCGNDPREAGNDALESLAQGDWEIPDELQAQVDLLSAESDIPTCDNEDRDCDNEENRDSDCYHYVSVRVSERTEEEREEIK